VINGNCFKRKLKANACLFWVQTPVILFRTVLLGIYLRNDVIIKNVKGLSPTVKKEGKGGINGHCSNTFYSISQMVL